MIYCLTCDCGGAEQIVRSVLYNAKYKNWLSQPIIRGSTDCLEFLSNPEVEQYFECRALKEHLRNNSSYVVILGIKDGVSRWADAARGGVSNRLDAELVAEQFAE